MLIHVTVSPPTSHKWDQMFMTKIQLTNSKKSVMVTKMTWLLFPLVVLSTLATGTLASVKDANVCDICDNTKQGQIRLKDPASNSSAGQVQLCISGYWQTVCSATNRTSLPRLVSMGVCSGEYGLCAVVSMGVCSGEYGLCAVVSMGCVQW